MCLIRSYIAYTILCFVSISLEFLIISLFKYSNISQVALYLQEHVTKINCIICIQNNRTKIDLFISPELYYFNKTIKIA